MGLISRLRRSMKSRANASVDKMTNPEKELDMAIMELEDTYKKAMQELLSYKATAKQMEQDMEREKQRADEWEKRAMAALKAGDEELARKALRERQNSLAEITKIKRDRDEAASYAIQLNNSRKTAETKLRMLKLRKGTMATQLKMARTGSTSPLGVDTSLFDKLDEAEQRIDEEAIEAEVFAAMEGEELGGKGMSSEEFDRKLLQSGADPALVSSSGQLDDPLEALKAKMAADKAKKNLPK